MRTRRVARGHRATPPPTCWPRRQQRAHTSTPAHRSYSRTHAALLWMGTSTRLRTETTTTRTRATHSTRIRPMHRITSQLCTAAAPTMPCRRMISPRTETPWLRLTKFQIRRRSRTRTPFLRTRTHLRTYHPLAPARAHDKTHCFHSFSVYIYIGILLALHRLSLVSVAIYEPFNKCHLDSYRRCARTMCCVVNMPGCRRRPHNCWEIVL